MVLSARGKKVDMVSLAKKYEKNVALGNAGYNGRGDKLGKNGEIVKTREEIMADWYAQHKSETVVENLKEPGATANPEFEKAKPTVSPVYEDITADDEELLKEAESQFEAEQTTTDDLEKKAKRK
jgi:hypothetical protein